MQPRTILGMPRAHAAILSLALALGLLACAMDGARSSWEPVPRQQWQKERGPVVPHDTFPRDCSLCHEGSTWNVIREDFRFDHAKETGLALLGVHDAAECLRCHNDRGPVAQFAQRGCIGCHEDVHQTQLGGACVDCHDESARDWSPKAAIADHARTRFPLVGAHASTACWACHPGAQVGNFANTTTNCVDCHSKDLARAVDPDHAAQGWTDSCQRCHLPTNWSQAGFNHRFFPLQGGHSGLACSDCHVGNDFGGLDPSCFACHSDDYQGARDHVSQDYSTDCTLCHTVNGWEGGHFRHTGIVTGCTSCHTDEYAQATQPDHAANGFSMSCEQCHNTQSWGDGTFDHADFPISSGHHSGISCQECHPVPGAFRQFACTNCHEHSMRETNNDHDRVQGYTYESSACYSCHPNGSED